MNTSVFDGAGSGTEAFWFTIRRGPGELALRLPLRFGCGYVVLSQNFDQPGQFYREADIGIRLGDGSAELWVGDERFPGCVESPVRTIREHAKLTGIDFRAAGTSPDWYLEIRRGGGIVFVSAADNLRAVALTHEPVVDGSEHAVYRAQAKTGELTVQIGGPSCSTPDQGGVTGTLVEVTLDGTRFTGCGRPLH